MSMQFVESGLLPLMPVGSLQELGVVDCVVHVSPFPCLQVGRLFVVGCHP